MEHLIGTTPNAAEARRILPLIRQYRASLNREVALATQARDDDRRAYIANRGSDLGYSYPDLARAIARRDAIANLETAWAAIAGPGF